MVLWITLWEYANQIGEQYFYTTLQDEALFKDYLKYIYYYNGVIGIDDKNPPSKYYYKTTYLNGEIILDINKEITYNNAGLDSTNDIALYTGAELWLQD